MTKHLTWRIHGIRILGLCYLICCITSCQVKNKTQEVRITNATSHQVLNPAVSTLMEEYKVPGMGIGYINNGALVKTEYYGEQSPNIPVSDSTMFNVASVTKSITAEVFLRLAAKGEVSLDEPISDYYVHADIVDDPRHRMLTPRVILSHRTGFRNWPHEYEDGRLAFINNPGSTFGYSGVGFYILARFLEEKLTTTYPHLVEETIFKPLKMNHSSIVIEPWFEDKRPTPVDVDGVYMQPYDLNFGYWNPADELHTTVEDYAKFIISALNNDGLTKELAEEKVSIISQLNDDPIFGTSESTKEVFYPPSYGYGIGWMIFNYGDGNKNVQHGGNDRGEGAMAYFHTKSKNGLIVFCNGGNAVKILPKVVEALDQEQRYTSVFNYILEKFFPD